MEQVLLRPLDVIVLLNIVLKEKSWTIEEVATDLSTAKSAVHRSLKRAAVARLYIPSTKSVNKNNLIEFINHGIKFCFPAQRSSIAMGIPTAYSGPPLKKKIAASKEAIPLIWPSAQFPEVKGESIAPLEKITVMEKIYQSNPKLYEVLTLVDAVRVGSTREIESARKMISKILE